MSLLSNIIGGLKRAFEPPAVIGLDVPYSSKEEAKRLGAKWDAQRGVWFVLGNQNLAPFEKWIPGSPAYRRIELAVPFEEKDQARQLGASWDSQHRKWYVPAGIHPKPFARWFIDDRGSEPKVDEYFGKPRPEGKLADDLGISGPIDPDRLHDIIKGIDDRATTSSRYYLRREDGGMGMGLQIDDLDEAKEMAAQAMADDSYVELIDNETGKTWRGADILQL